MEQFLSDLLLAMIIALVPVLSYYLNKFLSKIFNKIDVEIDSTHTRESLRNIFDLILSVVSSTSQTYVDSLKASGDFDKEAQEKAFNDCKGTIMTLLSDEYKEIIERLYYDVDTWINTQIEAAVRQLKNQ